MPIGGKYTFTVAQLLSWGTDKSVVIVPETMIIPKTLKFFYEFTFAQGGSDFYKTLSSVLSREIDSSKAYLVTPFFEVLELNSPDLEASLT